MLRVDEKEEKEEREERKEREGMGPMQRMKRVVSVVSDGDSLLESVVLPNQPRNGFLERLF